MEKNQLEAVVSMMIGILAESTGQVWNVSAANQLGEFFVRLTCETNGYCCEKEYHPYTQADIMIGKRGPFRPTLSDTMYSLRMIAQQIITESQNGRS